MNRQNLTHKNTVVTERNQVDSFGSWLVIALLLSLVVLVPACGSDIGSGVSKTEERVVAPFSQVQVQGDIEVRILVGQARSVLVTGDDNLLGAYETVVEDGVLVVCATGQVWYKVAPIVEIHIPTLDGVASSSTQDTVVQGLAADLFVVTVTGPADVILQGFARRLEVTQEERGNIWANGLDSQEVSCTLGGFGNAAVYASVSFDAVVTGPGHIDVHGSPVTREVEVSGAGYVTFK